MQRWYLDLGGERVGYSVYVHIKQRKAANHYTVCERPESEMHFFIDFFIMVGNTFSSRSL